MDPDIQYDEEVSIILQEKRDKSPISTNRSLQLGSGEKGMALSDSDIAEIVRISEKKSIRRIVKGIRKDLDREMLSKMISAYLVLKANGHSDNEFANYLTRRETKKMLKLGFTASKSALPALLTDGEFRSLVINTRKQMKKHKGIQEEEQRRVQQEIAEKRSDKSVAKVGAVTVTMNQNQPS
ncbi:MAG: hypothetical protein ACREBS_11510 [Nitrososphaerales archaeon]